MAKDITLKTRNGETRYPKTVTAIVYENGTGKTLQTIIDEMRQVDSDTNTRTQHFKADVNNLDTLKNKTDIGLYNYVGTGWRGSVSVCYDSADNVSQVALSSSTPSYNGNTLTWLSAQPCAMARTYKNGAWSHWEKVGAPVVNDLTTGGTDKALSAEMGKTLKEGLDALGPKWHNEITVFMLANYSLSSAGKFGSNTSYQHAIIPVSEGEKYVLVGNSATCRYAFATSPDYTSGGDIPLVNGTSVVEMPNIGQYYNVTIPAGCTHLLFNAGGTYATRLFKDLSAADIVALDAKINGFTGAVVAYDINSNLDYVYDHNQLKADSSSIGLPLSSVQKSSLERCTNKRVPLGNAKYIEYYQYESPSAYGSLFVDANDIVVGVVSHTSSSTTGHLSVIVPEGAVAFIWGIITTSSVTQYCRVYSESDSISSDKVVNPKTRNSVSDDIEGLASWKEIVTRKTRYYDKNSVLPRYKDGYQLLVTASFIGSSLDSVPTTEDNRYRNRIVSLANTNYIEIRQSASSYGYGSCFVDENNIILAVISRTSSESAYMTVQVPDGAAYLIWSYPTSVTENYCRCIERQTVSTAIMSDMVQNPETGHTVKEDLEILSSTINISSGSAEGGINAVQGSIASETGELVESTQYVTLIITGGKGFYLYLNDGYEVLSAHLFEKNGSLAAYDYLPPKNYFTVPLARVTEEGGLRRFYGSDAIPAGYYLAIVIIKLEGSVQVDIDASEPIINQFCYLDSGRLRRMEHDAANFLYAIEKINQLSMVRWTPKKDIYPANPSSGTPSSTYFFKAGQTRFGIPYSEAAQYSKYVGQHVSLYTYLTAINNRRSVMYTEKINGSSSGSNSGYGISYSGLSNTYASSYYGTVCTGLTAYAMGYDNIFVSDRYHDGGAPHLTEVANANAQNVKPLDIIWYSGHCSIIKDIILDEYGRRAFIVVAEQTKPTPYITPYTPALFEARLANSSCVVYRYSDWENNSPAPSAPFVQTQWFDYPRDIAYNDDICTMYGDKPCLAVGDILWLNFIKIKEYTTIVVEKYANDAWGTVQTITLSGNTNVREVSTDDTYNDINITSLNLTGGKYRAKLTGGSAADSGYTYWEMVDISLSASRSGSGVSITFASDNGTPYLIRQESGSGFMQTANRYKNLSAEDVTTGSVTMTSWTEPSTTAFIKVFVRGEYGVAVKMVAYPT